MFAKKARAHLRRRDLGRSIGLRRNAAAVRPCDDNQTIHLTAVTGRVHRPKLFCRWLKSPAGGLECRWATDAGDTNDEGISRFVDQSARRAVLRSWSPNSEPAMRLWNRQRADGQDQLVSR